MSTAGRDEDVLPRALPRAYRREPAGRRPGWVGSLAAVPEARWTGLSVALFAMAVLVQLVGGSSWAWGVLYAGCYVAGGWEPALAGVRALREWTLDVDLLMIVAALGAAVIGQVFDGALLIVIFATSGALEAWATARTEDSVRGLLELSPEEVSLITSDGERRMSAADLEVGDLIAVRPGEAVGADGVVVHGASEVDQATITGEPMPMAKQEGAEVFAGTVNGTGTLTVRVSRRAENSVMARIATLVEQASRTKARTQLFIEKVEQRYSVGVVVATVALFVVPLLAFGDDVQTALLRAMTFMIVASPCAVVLATMPPLLAAIANAGRRGVLIKSALVMEQLAGITTVAFDKTGTLTGGTPEVTALHPVGGDAWNESAILAAAAAAEQPSEHPLGRAVVLAAQRRGLVVATPSEFASVPGWGVQARVDGRTVYVQRPSALAGALPVAVAHTVRAVEDGGHTAVVVTVDEDAVGVLGLEDELRPDAASAVADLAVHTDRSPMLLTGDNPRTAAAVAAEVGLTDVQAALLPEQKVDAVETLRRDGHRVLMVGDGVNDAPALAAADVGVAMGGRGADLTLHAAGVVIVRDELEALPAVLALAQRARSTIIANLVIAATVIIGLVIWDLVGHLPLPLGVAGHEGSTVLVGLNGLRLLRRSAWPGLT